MTSNVCQVVEVLDSYEASITTSFSHGEALANFESNLNTSFSPICHRTRAQLANRDLAFIDNHCSSAPLYTVSGNIGDTSQNFLLEQDVSDTIRDILNNIPPCTPPSASIGDVPLSPCAAHVSSHTLSITASTGDEVILFPSVTEVDDLFSGPGLSPKFDFVQLICRQCQRRFFSAGGLENHLFAVHSIHIDASDATPARRDRTSVPLSMPADLVNACNNTGPPSRAPFTNIVPATTWATVAAKPAVTSTQPWAGQRISSTVSSSPRKTDTSGPSRDNVGTSQPATPSIPVPVVKSRKKIRFDMTPDQNSHVVLLPKKVHKKTRKVLPCPRCDFTFRTASSSPTSCTCLTSLSASQESQESSLCCFSLLR
ncbi:hypothetical protein CDAR_497831 [Caerostris darwini]|uniref:C2H2-type domain-containing protein n=1 Tax=Caerostris darwini TaxID=1538125 RepID=A0AAV4W9E7_9ARAC|nr:hypothetical protein CDAR_497831 [Caerostris darwini]